MQPAHQQQAQWAPGTNHGYPPQALQQIQMAQPPPQQPPLQQHQQPHAHGQAVIQAHQAANMFLTGARQHHFHDQAHDWNQRHSADPYKPQGGSDAIDPRTGRPYTEREGTVMTAKAAEAAEKLRNQKRSNSLGDQLKERAAQAKKAVQATTQAAIDARQKAELVVIGPRPSKASHDSLAAWVSYCACFTCFLVPIIGFFLLMLWQVSKQGYSYYQPRALKYPQRWQQTNCTLVDSDVQLQWFNPLSSQEVKATYRSVFTVNYQTILPYQAPGVPDLNLTSWYYVKGYRYAAALDNGGYVGYTHWMDSRMQGTGWACPILPGVPAAVTFPDAARLGFVQNNTNVLGVPSPLGKRRALARSPGYEAQLRAAELRMARGAFGRADAEEDEAAARPAEAAPQGGLWDPPAPAVGGEPGDATSAAAEGGGGAGRRLASSSYSYGRSYSGSSYSRSYSTRQTTAHRGPAPSYKYNCPDSREQAQFNWNLWLAQRARGSVPCWYPIDPAFPMGTPVVLSMDPSPTDYTCNVGCRVVWTFFVLSIIVLILWGVCACQFVFTECSGASEAAQANLPPSQAQATGVPPGAYPGYPGYPDQQGGYPQQGFDQQQYQGYYGGPNQPPQAAPAGNAGADGLHAEPHGAGAPPQQQGGQVGAAQQQPLPVSAGGGPGAGLHAETGQHDAAQQQQQPDWRQNNLYGDAGGQQPQQHWGGQPPPPAPGNAPPAAQWGGSVNSNPLAYG